MAAAPVRKKRNFKGLGLSEKALAPPPLEPEPLPLLGPNLVPTRPAPIPGSNANANEEVKTATTERDTPSTAGAKTPGVGGPKKKRPAQLSLGPKSVGGSAASGSNDKLVVNNDAASGNAGQANGKSILDDNGMLTIPAASGSAPVTATLGSASPFRCVNSHLDPLPLSD
jgi:mitogen-activated protein kinase kinase